MSSVIVDVAQYLLYALVLAAGVVWLREDRAGKLTLGAQAALGLVLVGIGIVVLAALHSDPRPFVTDGSRPLFPHPADNGFPSDHSVAGALLAALVLPRSRLVGVLVGIGAALVAWARVAAHVHHAQDVVAGLLLGAVCGALAVWLVDRLVAGALRGRGTTTADR